MTGKEGLSDLQELIFSVRYTRSRLLIAEASCMALS